MKKELKENNIKIDRLLIKIKDLFSVTQGCDSEKRSCQKRSTDYQHLTTGKKENRIY